jgi:superfamily I DNA/RNA helicase
MANIKCPICGGITVERRGKFGPFYGCAKYPSCKGIVNMRDIPKEEVKQFVRPVRKWSKLQRAIFDFVNDSGNLIVQAVAGSGKSTTLRELASVILDSNPDVSVLYTTFAKKNVDDMVGNIDPRVNVKTTHSVGFASLSAYLRSKRIRPDVNQHKYNDIMRRYFDDTASIKDAIGDDMPAMIKMIDLLRDTLMDITPENLDFLAMRYNIVFNGDINLICNAIAYCMAEGERLALNAGVIDYGDMIYLVVTGKVSVVTKYDWILCDETQDMNPAQLRLFELLLANNGRLVAVGDRRQSIFGFRAADPMAMDNIKTRFNCAELPLSVSYRCPNSAQVFVNDNYPDMEFSSGSVYMGEIMPIDMAKMAQFVDDGDLIICRNNAPLIKPCYALLKEGKKAVILGRDFSGEIIGTISKIAKKYECEDDINALLEAIDEFQEQETDRLSRMANCDNRIAQMVDKLNTIRELTEDMPTIQAMYDRIGEIFSDENGQITLSTIHRAKGAEADYVFLLDPDLIGRNAKQDWEAEQESNLRYVAHTRYKQSLYLVQ